METNYNRGLQLQFESEFIWDLFFEERSRGDYSNSEYYIKLATKLWNKAKIYFKMQN